MFSRKRDDSPRRSDRKSTSKYKNLPDGRQEKRKGPYELRKRGREEEPEAFDDAPFSLDNPPLVPLVDDSGKEIWNPGNPATRPTWRRPVQDRVYASHPHQQTVALPVVGQMTVYLCANGCGRWCPRSDRERRLLKRVSEAVLANVNGIAITRKPCEVQHRKAWRKYVIKNTIKRQMTVEGLTLDYYRTEEVEDVYHHEKNLEIWCKPCNKKDSKSGKGVSDEMLPEWSD